MKPLQQYFHMVRVVPTFESADEVLTCYHSNETFLAERFHGNIFLQGFYREKLQCFVNFFLGHHLIGVERDNLNGEKLRAHKK